MTEVQTTETKRDRVRRLLLTPLAENGFHFKRGSDPEAGRKMLDRLADDLAYLSDQQLATLCDCMRIKGEGTARNFWPTYATFVAYAQHIRARPLSEMPRLAAWFGGKAGRDALEDDRLVAEFRFWTRHHSPPVKDFQRRNVMSEAAEIQDRIMRIRDKQRRGVPLDPTERHDLDAYERDEAEALSLVRGAAA
ncbi:MAG: hypothetical protein GYB53_15025 [Rhodobacteraceae bacterium]|nr:hypothetical protein [Paracoccaceae bacterium]MBR9823722.1 hypothetical protein [Paracoccaceae bacterium]